MFDINGATYQYAKGTSGNYRQLVKSWLENDIITDTETIVENTN